MLLYPGKPNGNEFQEFLTDDFIPVEENEQKTIIHECKMGFVNVVDKNGEMIAIGRDVMAQLGL